MRGSSATASAGGTKRCTPGPTLSEKTGSINRDTPSSWTSQLAWPIQVRRAGWPTPGGCSSSAESTGTLGAAAPTGPLRRRPSTRSTTAHLKTDENGCGAEPSKFTKRLAIRRQLRTSAPPSVTCYIRRAMSAIRLPLLCAFVGGCLSNALLFGLWRASESSDASEAKQPHRAPRVVQVVAVPSAPTAAPSAADPGRELVAVDAEPARTPASEPTPTEQAPAGSAVSDVLMRLESAYRDQVAARAPATSPSTEERATAPVTGAAIAATEPP